MSELSPAQENEALHCQTGSSASFRLGHGGWVTTRLLGQARGAGILGNRISCLKPPREPNLKKGGGLGGGF